MSDGKGPPSDSLADILGPDLSSKLSAPRPAATGESKGPRPPAASGAPRPPGAGAPLPPPGPGGKGAPAATAATPRIAPPPPPPSLGSAGPVSIPRAPSAPKAAGGGAASFGAPRPPGSPAASPAVPPLFPPKGESPKLDFGASPAPRAPSPAKAEPPPGPDLGVSFEVPSITPERSAESPADRIAFDGEAASTPAPPAELDDAAGAGRVSFASGSSSVPPGSGPAAPPKAGAGGVITAEVNLPPVDFARAFPEGGAPEAPLEPTTPGATAPAIDDAAPPPPTAAAAPPVDAPAVVAPVPVPETAAPAPSTRFIPADDDGPGMPPPASGLGDLWRELPIAARIVVIGMPLLLVAASAALVLWLGHPPPPPPPWRGFVAATQPLVTGPAESFPSAGVVERGEPVERLQVERGWALVRDAGGRVGYVKELDLRADAPAPAPDAPFTRCQRRPLEGDAVACEQRGRGQLEACRKACTAAGCTEQCATRFVDCQLACSQLPGAAPPAPAVTEAVAAPPADEPKADLAKGKKVKKAKAIAKRKAKRKGG